MNCRPRPLSLCQQIHNLVFADKSAYIKPIPQGLTDTNKISLNTIFLLRPARSDTKTSHNIINYQ